VNDEPSAGAELAAFLWVVATMIALFELVWFFADRMYSV
jgi:hypothetical protein